MSWSLFILKSLYESVLKGDFRCCKQFSALHKGQWAEEQFCFSLCCTAFWTTPKYNPRQACSTVRALHGFRGRMICFIKYFDTSFTYHSAFQTSHLLLYLGIAKSYPETTYNFTNVFSLYYIIFDINPNNMKITVLFQELKSYTILPAWSLPKEITYAFRLFNMKIKLGLEKRLWLSSKRQSRQLLRIWKNYDIKDTFQPYTKLKNKLKVEQRSKRKARHYKTLRGKHRQNTL